MSAFITTASPLSLPSFRHAPRRTSPIRTNRSPGHATTIRSPPRRPRPHLAMSSACLPTPTPSPTPPPHQPALLRRLLSRNTLLSLAAVVSLIAVARHPAVPNPTQFLKALTDFAATLGTPRATLLLFCTNFVTVLCCFPANMGLMIAAGAILPPANAFLALFLSKVAAACTAFALARTLLRNKASEWLARYPKLAALSQSSSSNSPPNWTFVLLMRLSPFPGFALNYLLSLTSVSFFNYALGTVLGIAPSIANLVLIGDTAKNVGAGVVARKGPLAWTLTATKLATVCSMITVMVYVTRMASAAFEKQQNDLQHNDLAQSSLLDQTEVGASSAMHCDGDELPSTTETTTAVHQ